MRPGRVLVLGGLAVVAAALFIGPQRIAFGSSDPPCTSLSVENVQSPTALADSSEYLVTATLSTEPEDHPLPDWNEMRYWVGEARIARVWAQRPDAQAPLSEGQTIRVGTELLRPRADCGTSNAAVFPTEEDRPHLGDRIVVFLVHRDDLAGSGAGYEAAGQAVVAPDGTVTVRAVPGELNHRSLPLAAVTTESQSRYAEPAPWRRAPG